MEKNGFYPKHVQMEMRHNQTPLPDEQLNSDSNTESGRPLRPHYNTPKPPITIGGNHDDSYRTDEVNVLLPVLIGFIVALVVLAIIILVYYLLRKCFLIKHQNLSKIASICIREPVNETTIHQPPTRPYLGNHCDIESFSDRGSRGLWPEMDPKADVTPIEPELLEEIRAERCAGLGAALNDDSDEENTTDPNMEEEHTEEVHDTQSLCDTEATPAAARGAMGSKIISLPNFAMEREDTDQNTVTQNALLLKPPRRCRSKTISLPNLTQDRKDSDDSS
ncbi:uncharacterized protein LOC125275912 isoform X4 [Megalobrama amblycephala]|uniref:uncharacterized protein LOC125275912 isoform X4 n=1 Tax=Megalobrama amblycephala TaxID=75352 RepID=UPI0020142E91|nr:uncharacterized protein LOC125275912 isoform X4 [Megalobrama amblycephala]